MKLNARNMFIAIASLTILLLAFYYLYPFYPQEVIVEGWRLKPEGTQVSGSSPFSSSRIYTFNIRSQSFMPLSPENIDSYAPVWSPNGKRLAYLYIQNNEKAGIAVIDEDKQTKYFDFPPEISEIEFELAWSPNNASILFLKRFEGCDIFYLLNLKDGLIDEADDFPKLCEEAPSNLAWSSNGSILVEVNRNIFALDPINHDLHFIVEGYEPVWHPNGKQFIYVCKIPNKGFNGLCETTADGKDKHILIQQYFDFHDLSWVSGTKYIGFLQSTGADSDQAYLTVINMTTKTHPNSYQITGRGKRKIWIQKVAWHP